MARTILGVDIGQDQLKLALVSGSQVKKIAIAAMPERLLHNGRIVSVETMGELIRDTMRKEHIRAAAAAVVLTGENVYVRNVTMPVMTAKQLDYNLPFEFRDYITGELKDFRFDYAMYDAPAALLQPAAVPAAAPDAGPDAAPGVYPDQSMNLLAVALPAEQVEENRAALRKAGLKMVKAAPGVCAWAALLAGQPQEQEYCILDLGYTAIRLYVLRGSRHIVTRVLEQGLSALDQSIADANNVDIHLAHTYLLANHEDCQNSEACLAPINAIAVELMRALNFYRFSNPDSNPAGMWLCGGGARIAALKNSIAGTLDLPVHLADELVPGGSGIEDCATLAQAIGITQN